jgi:CheY-like chemotaxis protein
MSHESNHRSRGVSILMADDDPDDVELTRDALEEARVVNKFESVADGEELMDFLLRRGRYADRAGDPLPGIILLDLNMPKMDGREALREIKCHPELKRIPVVVLTTSKAQEDIYRTYDLGVNSFVSKPVSFDQLVDVMRTLSAYWLNIVHLPDKED